MATKIVRLHRFDNGRIDVLERSPERLSKAAQHGGQVFDVTVEKAPWRREAERVLALAMQPFDPFADDAGDRARARRDVVPVPFPSAPPAAPDDAEAV